MRSLKWRHGRAWIARRPDEWPANLFGGDASPTARTVTLPATTTVTSEVAVAVDIVAQTADSCAFARVGGHLRPDDGGHLVVTIRLPVGIRAGTDLEQVLAGIAELPERPAGRLEISWHVVSVVDSTPQAWRWAGAALGRLMLPDVAGMSDDAAALAAQEAGERQMDANPSIVIAPDTARLAEWAAEDIRAIAAAAIAERGRFRVALAGGSTPRLLYPHLVDGVDWTRADVFFGDERAVPPDDVRSNYRMARETLLEPARVPAANVFRWRAESPDLDAAAREYEAALRARGTPPWLDLALLGLGPDGHTASLFPGSSALTVEDRLATPLDVPALAVRRLTLTYPALIGAKHVIFLVAGAEKRAALAGVLRRGSTLPAARIVRRQARVRILCDAEAAQDINPSP